MPNDLKLRKNETKYFLKKTVTGKLPENILNRKKQGFGVPVASWLADSNAFPFKSDSPYSSDARRKILKKSTEIERSITSPFCGICMFLKTLMRVERGTKKIGKKEYLSFAFLFLLLIVFSEWGENLHRTKGHYHGRRFIFFFLSCCLFTYLRTRWDNFRLNLGHKKLFFFSSNRFTESLSIGFTSKREILESSTPRPKSPFNLLTVLFFCSLSISFGRISSKN